MTSNELCILYPGSIYPLQSGGAHRTLNIAKLGTDMFSNISVLTVDEENTFERDLGSIRILQAKKYHSQIDKLRYYFEGAFLPSFSLKTPELKRYINDSTLFQIEGPYFYNALKKTGIKKYILNEHNVYWEFSGNRAFNINDIVFYKLTSKRNKSIEIRALKDAAHVLACSKRDAHVLIDEVPEIENKITIVPNCVNFKEYTNFQKDHPQVSDKSRSLLSVLFVGVLTYPPNRDAIEIISSRIAPNFGKDVEFLIIGKNPPNISKPANVHFLGYVEDVKEYIQNSDICIAPLRYGSGTRFKILEYMAMGKPVVSTSKGAEGIDYTNYQDIIIEDDFAEFSGRIAELLENGAMRKQLGKNAQQLIRQKYDWEIYRKPIHDAYEACF